MTREPWKFYLTEQELAKSRRRAVEWIIPFVESWAGTRSVHILSVGSGNGMDVVSLRERMKESWALDSCRYFPPGCGVQGNALNLPFKDSSFDIVLALEVIEHIGTLDDSVEVLPGYSSDRQGFVAQLVRVTSPKGVIVIATPNKWCPFDEHSPYWFPVRVHAPWDRFLLSYAELRSLFRAAGMPFCSFLSPRRYFAMTRFGGNLAAKVTDLLLPALSNRLLGWTPLNPHLFLCLSRVPVAREGGWKNER